jgi:hypothetical protein
MKKDTANKLWSALVMIPFFIASSFSLWQYYYDGMSFEDAMIYFVFYIVLLLTFVVIIMLIEMYRNEG